jgi:hypothetical protein
MLQEIGGSVLALGTIKRGHRVLDSLGQAVLDNRRAVLLTPRGWWSRATTSFHIMLKR